MAYDDIQTTLITKTIMPTTITPARGVVSDEDAAESAAANDTETSPASHGSNDSTSADPAQEWSDDCSYEYRHDYRSRYGYYRQAYPDYTDAKADAMVPLGPAQPGRAV